MLFRSGLDFIDDQHDAVLIGHLAQGAHQLGGHGVETALTLHRLDDDGRNPRRGDVGLEEAIQLLEGFLDADSL